MEDAACVRFLQWALPRLGMRWAGFRRVRRQVCKRIGRRIGDLNLPDASSYRSFLELHPEEWKFLDGLCRVQVSRFYRDRVVFEILEREVLPRLAETVAAGGGNAIRCWSAGCASGEEPYTLALMWECRVAPRIPRFGIGIVATDSDAESLRRAEAGIYARSSLKDLPADLRERGFDPSTGWFVLKPEYRNRVVFALRDVRSVMPEGPFYLILCRNIVFTYFDEDLQREILKKLWERLVPGGFLVIGRRESLPEGAKGFDGLSGGKGIYTRK